MIIKKEKKFEKNKIKIKFFLINYYGDEILTKILIKVALYKRNFDYIN